MSAAWRTPYDLYEEKRSASAQDAGLPLSAPTSVADTVQVRGITIAGWRVETHRGSIADSNTIDTLSDAWGIPLPEMPFDKNRLVLHHEPTGWRYEFDGFSALRSVEGVASSSHLSGLEMETTAERAHGTRRHNVLGERPKSKRVQVSYANEWGRKRDQQQATSQAQGGQTGIVEPTSHFGPEIAAAAADGRISTARDFDWTYSCHWPGCETSRAKFSFTPGTDPRRDRIPLERLGAPTTPGAKAEPILFFDDVILYEDELGDNGTSMLSVKVRVMPTGLLVLQRFFLRVDNVVFRTFDTRMYVAFYEDDVYATNSAPPPTARPMPAAPTAQMGGLSLGAPRRAPQAASTAIAAAVPRLASAMRVIRECSGSEVRYADVKARLPPYKPNDLSLLTDVGWVSQQITRIEEDKERKLRMNMIHAAQANGQTALHPGTIVSQDAQADPTSPAVLPSTTRPGHESNRILGEIHDDADDSDVDAWEGQGHRVDVLELPTQ